MGKGKRGGKKNKKKKTAIVRTGSLSVSRAMMGLLSPLGMTPSHPVVKTKKKSTEAGGAGSVREDDTITRKELLERDSAPYEKDSHSPDNAGWVDIDMEQVRSMMRIYRTDPNIRLAAGIDLREALDGTIDFAREGLVLGEDAKEWTSGVWSRWAEETMSYRWAIGFVAVSWIPHPLYGKEPTVIPIERDNFRIMYRRSNLGMHQWAILIQTTEIASGWKYMPDVRFFVKDPPDPNSGTLMSRVCSIYADAVYEKRLRDIAMWVNEQRALPMAIIEHVDAASGAGATADKTRFTLASRGGRGGPMSGKPQESREEERVVRKALEAAERVKRLTIAGGRDFNISVVEGAVRDQLEWEASEAGHVRKLRLDTDEKYVPAPVPETPEDIVRQSILQTQRVLLAWQWPPMMVLPENTQGKTLYTESQAEFIRRHRKDVKKEAVGMIRDHYRVLFEAEQVAEYVEQRGVRYDRIGRIIPITEDEVRRAAHVNITMPGIPERKEVDELWEMGILTPEALRTYVVANLGINPNMLRDPVIDPVDKLTAGKTLLPTPTAAGGGGGAAKSKKPRKPKK